MMKREPCRLVQSPAVWSVLVAPVRAEIVEALRLLGPCSLAEIGDAIDRPADSLYKHLQLLQQAGYVVQAGFRKGSRNVEQLVDVVADDFMIDFHDGTGAAENKAIITTANSFLKAMGRAVRDSAKARQLDFRPDKRNIAINYELSWLTPEAFQEVRELVRQLKQLMDDGKKRRAGRLYLSLVVATPVTRRRGARERGGKSKQPARAKAAQSAPAKKRPAKI
jgi:DNA-binding transcriptional ArsR family regulator